MAKFDKKRKINIPITAACVLLILTALTTHMTSGLYARYATSGSGSDSARVISFKDITLTETGDFDENGTLIIIPGVNLTKKVTVDFGGSEAATYVFVEIIPTGWTTTDNKNFYIDTKMSWEVADGWTFLSKKDGSYIYYQSLAPNAVLADVDVIAKDGEITVSDQITKWNIDELQNISLSFRATVVQSNGFESPAAAWESLSGK